MFAEKTMEKLTDIIADEQKNAETVYGKTYSSRHEAYGVLAEEVDEAKERMEQISACLKEYFSAVRFDEDGMKEIANMSREALMCAAECCQIAACCGKAIDTFMER